MTPGKISCKIIADRVGWIDRMLNEIGRMPLTSYETFTDDRRNVLAAESCLRRTLEALMDVSRHILAKGFGLGVTEYKQVALEIQEVGVLSHEDARLLKILAGYRNRMVHFYHEIVNQELYEICRDKTQDIQKVKEAIIVWIKDHPDLMDEAL